MRKLPAVLLPLPLGEVASRSDDGEGARLMGAAPALSRYDPTRENGIAERPQALRYPEIKI